MKFSKYLVFFFVLFACKPERGYKMYSGEAQGTTFSIKYESVTGKEFDDGMDSIFQMIDANFSTYKPASVISAFNNSDRGVPVDEVFADLWEKCWELNILTDGYFDPTLSMVFDVYSSMQDDILDSALINESLMHTGMPLVSLKGDSLIKRDSKVEINLNAIAQGYTVDLLSDFLTGKGIKNFMVEVGGEVFAVGRNDKGYTWKIGIDKPIERGRQLITALELDEMSLATSGNYRKFVVINGKKMGHIINPKTGFPGYSNILSVSVLSRNCYKADALATGLMNMSSAEIKEFDQNMDDIQIILIELHDGDTTIYVSPELREKVRF